MGKAKKCDRCGGFYTYNDHKYYDGEVACLKTVSVSPVFYSTSETYWDICPECTAKLNNWLNGKDFEDKEN